MDSNVVKSKECQDYILYSRKLAKYHRTKANPPVALENKYKVALEKYRHLLDTLGYKMPKRDYNVLCFT